MLEATEPAEEAEELEEELEGIGFCKPGLLCGVDLRMAIARSCGFVLMLMVKNKRLMRSFYGPAPPMSSIGSFGLFSQKPSFLGMYGYLICRAWSKACLCAACMLFVRIFSCHPSPMLPVSISGVDLMVESNTLKK